MIAKETIDKVYDIARVEEVIADYVQLKRSGSNLKGLSPFTDERTPSFMVSPVKQIWKDFSSGKGGNVVAFVMEHEHLSYPEAIRHLAKRYQIEIVETEQSHEEKEKLSERESMFLVTDFAREYFEHVLWNEEEGKAIGMSYLKERGFQEATIRKFHLGYCLDRWDGMTKAALEKGYQIEFLEKTGLTIVKEEKQFDRFKGRVMFPIHSLSGRPLGFGGRILRNDKKAAKYLNSPESELYHKSKILYGIYQAKQAIAKEDNCYLVEGYTDVIRFHQSGIENVVASSGTALTADQIRLVKRLTNTITVLFDGDAAGIRASVRGIDLILEEGMNVKVCTFPDGEDPDSFAAKKSNEELRAYLEENTTDFIRFKASLLVNEAKDDPIKRAETIREIVHSIARIPDRIQREVYIKECARIMDISEAVLFNTLAQLGKKLVEQAGKQHREEQKAFEVVRNEPAVTAVDQQEQLERKIIEVLLLYGSEFRDFNDLVLKANEQGELVMEPVVYSHKVYEKIFLDLQQDEVELANPLFRKLFQMLVKAYAESEGFRIQEFIQETDPDTAAVISSVLLEEERYVLHDWGRKNIFVKDKLSGVAQLVSETILSLRCLLINRQVDRLQETIGENPGGDHQQIVEEIVDYLRLRSLLADKLNRVIV